MISSLSNFVNNGSFRTEDGDGENNGSKVAPTPDNRMKQSSQTQSQQDKHKPKSQLEIPSDEYYTQKIQTSISKDDQEEEQQLRGGKWHQQTSALLRKNLLLKTRAPIGTFLELFSPAIFMLILVFGYELSEIKYRDSKTYTSWDLDFPNEVWSDLIGVDLEGAFLEDIEIDSFLDSNNTDLNLDGNQSIIGINALTGRRGGINNLFQWQADEHDWGRKLSLKEEGYDDEEDELDFLPFFWRDLIPGSKILPSDEDDKLYLHKPNHNCKESDLHKPRSFLRSLENITEGLEDGWNETNFTDDDELIIDDDTSFAGGGYDTIGSIGDFRKEIRDLLQSPTPIPTLTQYLALANRLSSNLDVTDFNDVFQSSSTVRQWGNLLTLGTIHIVSSSSQGALVNEFIDYLGSVHSVYNQSVSGDGMNDTSSNDLLNFDIMIRTHPDSDQAIDFIMSNLNERTFVLIEFDESQDDNFAYKIRMNSTTLPNTNQITNLVSIGLNRNYQRYYFSGYLTWQRTLNEFALQRIDTNYTMASSNNDWDDDTMTNTGVADAQAEKLQPQCNVPDPTVWTNLFMMPLPTLAYSQNPFFTSVGFLLGLTIAMAFLFPVSRLIKFIVEEKESRMKETLAILGVRTFPYTFSLVITSFLSFGIIALSVSFILSFSVFKYSSSLYIFAYIFLFSTSTAGFSFFIASFFSRAKLSAIVGPIALFATLLPRWIFFGTNRYEATPGKYWASLLPCTAFAFGADIIADYEYAELGIQSFNVLDAEYSFQTTLNFLFLDTIIYGVLGLYLDQVLPRTFGIPKKWYFCLVPPFWKGIFFGHSESLSTSTDNEAQQTDSDDVEVSNRPSKVNVIGLVKKYHAKAEKVAVDGLNLSMFESEIFCLLGHNGAGKTTTMSIMTGLYTSTYGDVNIYGKSINKQLGDCRQLIGLCPQHNILFDNLTVLEHLALFERINGQIHTKESTISRAEEVGLGEFLHTKSSRLSGGNKRKLCLGIALCGDKKVLVLDEPTSGMDPRSRRLIWDLLRKKRHGRVILLTTHFMDEAEILADRIAILKEGRLQCCGSLLFLQQRFGLGYNLTVVDRQKSENMPSSPMTDELITGKRSITSNSNDYNDDRLDELIKRLVPGSWQIQETSGERMYRLKRGSEEKFAALFDEMEKKSNELKIESFGVSNSSLQDIFFGLSESGQQEQQDIFDDSPMSLSGPLSLSSTSNYNVSIIMQISILMKKRYIIQKRDKKGGFFLIILPVILITLVMVVLLVEVPLTGPAIDLSLSLYNTPSSGDINTIIMGDSDTTNDMMMVFGDAHVQTTFSSLDDLNTSQDLSNYLLDTNMDENRNIHFGAYVHNDKMYMEVNVDWSEILESQGIDSNDTLSLDDFSNSSEIEDTSSFTDIFNTTVLSNITSLIDDISNATETAGLNLTEIIEEITYNTSKILRGEKVSYEFNITSEVSILHNTSSPHAVAAYAQSYYNYLFMQCHNNTSTKLSAVNHPLPLTSRQSTEVRFYLSIFVSLFLLIPFGYIPPTFATFVVKERSNKSKHLQLVSGVDMFAYWVSSFAWDLIGYAIITLLVILIFLSYGEKQAAIFVGTRETLFCSCTLIWGYGISSIPFAYLLSSFE